MAQVRWTWDRFRRQIAPHLWPDPPGPGRKPRSHVAVTQVSHKCWEITYSLRISGQIPDIFTSPGHVARVRCNPSGPWVEWGAKLHHIRGPTLPGSKTPHGCQPWSPAMLRNNSFAPTSGTTAGHFNKFRSFGQCLAQFRWTYGRFVGKIAPHSWPPLASWECNPMHRMDKDVSLQGPAQILRNKPFATKSGANQG